MPPCLSVYRFFKIQHTLVPSFWLIHSDFSYHPLHLSNDETQNSEKSNTSENSHGESVVVVVVVVAVGDVVAIVVVVVVVVVVSSEKLKKCPQCFMLPFFRKNLF